jgi:hypothetical protein
MRNFICGMIVAGALSCVVVYRLQSSRSPSYRLMDLFDLSDSPRLDLDSPPEVRQMETRDPGNPLHNTDLVCRLGDRVLTNFRGYPHRNKDQHEVVGRVGEQIRLRDPEGKYWLCFPEFLMKLVQPPATKNHPEGKK